MNTEASGNTARNTSKAAGLKEGNLLIPDISGFTKFVNDMDMVTGKYIISRLLNVLLDSNMLGLKVSEIEGDAILFHKFGRRFSRQEILAQFGVMQDNFSEALSALSQETGEDLQLGLKLIAHYGPLSEYRVGRFTKLYGRSVIEAHRLLKNSVDSDQYVIMTDELLNVPQTDHEITGFGIRLCEQYNHLEHICFTWLGFNRELWQDASFAL